jgi:hypothetical protein
MGCYFPKMSLFVDCFFRAIGNTGVCGKSMVFLQSVYSGFIIAYFKVTIKYSP